MNVDYKCSHFGKKLNMSYLNILPTKLERAGFFLVEILYYVYYCYSHVVILLYCKSELQKYPFISKELIEVHQKRTN